MPIIKELRAFYLPDSAKLGLVVDQSKKVFWTFEGMASSLRPFIRKEEGVIKIFANYGAAIDFLPYDLAEYMAVHNEISFVLEQRPLSLADSD